MSSKRATAVLWVVLVCQCLSAAWVAYPWISGDTNVYRDLAASLARGFYGHVTAEGMIPDALRPPGLPVTLWLLQVVAGLPDAGILAVQLLAYLASIALIHRYLLHRGQDGRLFLTLVCAYPFAVVYSSYIATEAWVTLLLTSLAMLMATKRLGLRQSVFAGLLAGVAALFRTDMLLLPLLVAAILFGRWLKGDRRDSIFHSAAAACAALVVLAPYAAWNSRHFGSFLPAPAAAAAGSSLYTATWQHEVDFDDFDRLYQGRFSDQAVKSGLAAEVSRLNRSIGAPPNTPPFNPVAYPTAELQIAANRAFGRAALGRILSQPDQYATHVAGNLWRLWNTGRYPEGVSTVFKILLAIVSGIVFLAGCSGVGLTLKYGREWNVSRAPILFLVYPFLVHLPLHTEARYTASARPLLLMFASLALMHLWRTWIGPGVNRRRAGP